MNGVWSHSALQTALPAPAKASKSSPLESERAMSAPSAAKKPTRFAGNARICNSYRLVSTCLISLKLRCGGPYPQMQLELQRQQEQIDQLSWCKKSEAHLRALAAVSCRLEAEGAAGVVAY